MRHVEMPTTCQLVCVKWRQTIRAPVDKKEKEKLIALIVGA
ncbi:MAG: hypothetical protein ACNA7O_13615 [Rhodobacterales bacterium]